MLNWGFYYDDWLIDPLPQTMILKVFEGSEGLEVHPKNLKCYFGALPTYIYGEAKFQHEVFLSPSGVAIIPEFLNVVNGDIIPLESVRVFFPRELDFHGTSNRDKHFGYVKPSQYIENIQKKLYQLSPTYSNKTTPTHELRLATVDELSATLVDPMEYQVYKDVQEMGADGIVSYFKMDREGSNAFVKDEMEYKNLYTHTDRAYISERDGYREIRDIKNMHLSYGANMADKFNQSGIVILFKTLPLFSFGKIISFGDYEEAGSFHGFSLHIEQSSILLCANDGTSRSWTSFAIFDWSVSHKIKISCTLDDVSIRIDSTLVMREKIDTLPLFTNTSHNYIAGKMLFGRAVPSKAGNISELIICTKSPSLDKISRFFDFDIPFIRSGTLPTLESLNNKPTLTFELTFKDEHLVFIPNYLNEPIYKLYTEDIHNEELVIYPENQADNYRKDLIKIPNKVYEIPNNTKIKDMLIGTDTDYIQRDFKALTKLTSNTHYPVGIIVDFIIPDYFKKENAYSFSLKMKSLSKFLHYKFTKFRDEI